MHTTREPSEGSRRPGSREGTRKGSERGESPVRLHDPEYAARIAQKLVQVAWFRYRIPVGEAQDVVQNAFAAFLEVRHRYEAVADHPAILVGVFRKKCLEHIDRAVREKRKLAKYCASADAARESAWIHPRKGGEAPSVLDQIVRKEERERIHEAIDDLKPASRSLISLMAEKEFDRQKVIEHLKLNKNTVDSRLHVTRRELRRLLQLRDLSL